MGDRSERVCIIGGGPAGIAAAMYLQKKGYKNYEIYERLNKVGGKAYSPKITVNGEERSYETGAIMGAKTYYAVHELEQFAGITHDGPIMRRMYRNADGQEIFPFDPKVDFTPQKLVSLLQLKAQMKKLVKIMNTKYKGYDLYGHVGVAKGEYSGLSKEEGRALHRVKGVNPNLKDLALPFSEFCKLNGVEAVQKIWIAPYTSFGYGFFDEIPAAYVMKYLDTTTAIEFVAMRLWTWKDGTQSIYESVNKKLAHPAHLNTEVVKIERPEDGKVYVTIRDLEPNGFDGTKNGGNPVPGDKMVSEVAGLPLKKGASSHERTEVFDKLIVTTPLDRFLNMADEDETEQELFSKIRHERYVDFIARFQDHDGPTISGYIFDNMVPQKLGHAMVYYHRWQDQYDNCPCSVYALRNHEKYDDVPYDYTIRTMQDDMALCGFPVKERLYEQESYYCPHITPKDYADGWYDRLDAIQGQKNTYYAGEILSFGDMEDTCAASRDIVGRFF